MKSRVTRQDVARLAGVSTAVVSYVINDGPRPVSAAAKERVLAAIEATGYAPNRAAQALVSGRSRSIGLLIPNAKNLFLAELTHALGKCAFEANYTLVLGDAADSTERERELVRHFMNQQLGGFIWYSVDQPVPVKLLRQHCPTTVLLNATASTPTTPNAVKMMVDEKKQGYMAMQHLICRGSEQLAVLAGPAHRENTQARLAGSNQAASEYGRQIRQVEFTDFTEAAGAKAFERFKDIDGLVTANERQALGVLHAANLAGVAIPETLKVVAINGTEFAKFASPGLSTVDQDVAYLARKTIEVMENPREEVEIPVMMRARESSGGSRNETNS